MLNPYNNHPKFFYRGMCGIEHQFRKLRKSRIQFKEGISRRFRNIKKRGRKMTSKIKQI